jgi:hypothetical protein
MNVMAQGIQLDKYGKLKLIANDCSYLAHAVIAYEAFLLYRKHS